jgi:hypothetical protein
MRSAWWGGSALVWLVVAAALVNPWGDSVTVSPAPRDSVRVNGGRTRGVVGAHAVVVVLTA